MKNTIVDSNGNVAYGIFHTPIENINYQDYPFQLSSGYQLPKMIRPFFVNQFIFLGISSNDLFIGLAVIDLKYAAKAFLYAYDRNTGQMFEDQQLALPNVISIDSRPDACRSSFQTQRFSATSGQGHFFAKTSHMILDASLDFSALNPFRICSRAGYNGWVYTQKSTPVIVSGNIVINDKKFYFQSPNAMAMVDWTCGYMQRETFWNWASITTTLNDDRHLGLNLSCGVNETSFTENFFVIGNQMTKVDMVHFKYDKKDLYKPWTIQSYDEKIHLSFSADHHRSENMNAWFVASRFSQLMGRFTGHLKTDKGEMISINNCPGWAEDHFARW
jgi:hypothetical protein